MRTSTRRQIEKVAKDEVAPIVKCKPAEIWLMPSLERLKEIQDRTAGKASEGLKVSGSIEWPLHRLQAMRRLMRPNPSGQIRVAQALQRRANCHISGSAAELKVAGRAARCTNFASASTM